MSLFYSLASIEVAEKGKIVCLANGDEISPGLRHFLENNKLGDALIIDLDAIRKLSGEEQEQLLKQQVASHFPAWREHPSLSRVCTIILSGSHHFAMLEKLTGSSTKAILPFLSFEGAPFATNERLNTLGNFGVSEILKKVLLYHEASHLMALADNDASHHSFGDAAKQETYADIGALRALGADDPDLLSTGLEALVCWRAYQYLFRRSPLSNYYPCRYLTNVGAIKPLLVSDAAIGTEQVFENLENHVRGIQHATLAWLDHNGYRVGVKAHSGGGDLTVVGGNKTLDRLINRLAASGSRVSLFVNSDADRSVLPVLEAPFTDSQTYAALDLGLKLSALAELALLAEATVSRNFVNELSDSQRRLIQYSLLGFSFFDKDAKLLNADVLRVARLETEEDFRIVNPIRPPAKSHHSASRNRLLLEPIPKAAQGVLNLFNGQATL